MQVSVDIYPSLKILWLACRREVQATTTDAWACGGAATCLGTTLPILAVAGLELNQCTGDVDHCSFHQNQVCADADKISNTLLVCDNLPGGRRAEWMLLVVSCHSDCCQIVHNICNDICSLACTHELALMQSRERRVAESSWTSVHPAC